MSDTANADTSAEKQAKAAESEKVSPDLSNVLSHIKQLEITKADLEKALKEANERNSKLSQKTREGMQSALDTLMKKWISRFVRV